MIDFLKQNDDITDEMLAAYIDGNATEYEKLLIDQSLTDNELLSETIDIVNDSIFADENLLLDKFGVNQESDNWSMQNSVNIEMFGNQSLYSFDHDNFVEGDAPEFVVSQESLQDINDCKDDFFEESSDDDLEMSQTDDILESEDGDF